MKKLLFAIMTLIALCSCVPQKPLKTYQIVYMDQYGIYQTDTACAYDAVCQVFSDTILILSLKGESSIAAAYMHVVKFKQLEGFEQ